MSFTKLLDAYVNHMDMDTHPNGTRFFAITQHPNAGEFNLAILRHIPNKSVETLRVFKQGKDIAGPFGYCSISCQPDGSVCIGISGAVFKVDEVVAAYTFLPGVAPAYGTPGAVPIPVTTPIPVATTTTDDVARARAQQALDVANAAANKAAAAAKAVSNIPRPPDPVSDDHIHEVAFHAANDALFAAASKPNEGPFAHTNFVQYIRDIAQANLLGAIEYATTNSQSKLRALVVAIINAVRPLK